MITLILISFLLCLITLKFAGVAAFSFSIFILTIGIFLCCINKYSKKDAFIVYGITFIYYVSFALIHYLSISKYNIFVYPDEAYFFKTMVDIGAKDSVSDIFIEIYRSSYNYGNPGYITYLGTVGLVLKNMFGSFNEMSAFLSSVLFGTLASVVMFNLLHLYSIKQPLLCAVLFMLFSPFSEFSVVLLRDIHIAFFYLCGFYIILKPYSIKNILLLFLLTIAIWQFRMEHGLFFIVFIIYYLYISFIRYRVILIPFGIIFGLTLIPFYFGFITEALSNYTLYSDRQSTIGLGIQDDSLSRFIFAMPHPFRELLSLIDQQLQPFPPYYFIISSDNVYQQIFGILSVLYSTFWFVVIFSTIKLILFNKSLKYLSSNMRLLLFIVLIFLIANTSEINVRRVMCVYPIIYFIYLIMNNNLSIATTKNAKIYGIVIYISINIFYVVLKYSI